MEEEFNLTLDLDEAAEARIAHADFLTKIKDWGAYMGLICAPFAHISQTLIDGEVDKETIESIITAFPMGTALMVEHLNELYDIIQNDAIIVLGSPFAFHDEHSNNCDGTKDFCGHQDHWTKDAE